MYKIFIHTVTNAFENEAVQFPRLSNIPTYCFKITRQYEKKLRICARKGFDDFPFKQFYNKFFITALNIKVTDGSLSVDGKVIKKGNFNLIHWPENADVKVYYN